MTSEKWSIGDIFPLETQMGNTVHTEILDRWVFSNVKGLELAGWLYDEKAILWFIDKLRWRYENDLKSHILGTGDLGSGKSTASQVRYRLYQFASNNPEKYQDLLAANNFDIYQDMMKPVKLKEEDCCFKLERLKERIFQNKPNPKGDGHKRPWFSPNYYIMDESGKELSSHKWQDKYVEDMKQQLDVSRVQLEVIDMNLPHIKGIINGIREANADFLSYCSAFEEGRKYLRGWLEVREAQKDRWNLDIWWRGSLACKFRQLDDEEYDSYFGWKLAYVKAGNDPEKPTDEVDRFSQLCYNLNKNWRELRLEGKVPMDALAEGAGYSNGKALISRKINAWEEQLAKHTVISEPETMA
jgi:hypothetical protein